MIEVKVPELGENIERAEVLRVLVAEGDTLEAEQPVLELETDKATFELPASQAGRVKQVHVKVGDSITIGQTVLTLEEAGAGAGAREGREDRRGTEPRPRGPREARRPAPEKSEKEEAAEEEAERREAPRRGAEGSAEGGRAARGAPAPTEAEEAEGEETPQAEGEARVPAGQTARPIAEEAENGRGKGRPAPVEEAEEAEPEEEGEAEAAEPLPAGPATRRLARELGVDLRRVPGSGAGGRITPEDVKAAVREGGPARPAPSAPSLPDFERWGRVERRELTGLQRTAAERLALSWRMIPHVTQHDVADVTEMEAARRRYDAARGPADPRVTVTALAVKVAMAALKRFPQFNSSLDVARGEVIHKRYYHIGVAVDTEHGLLVPVLRDVDCKTARQVAVELDGLAQRARERKLTREELQGATFTVTNLGGLGGTAFTPIVNYPEVAILGLSQAREGWVTRDGGATSRLLLPLSLSYDHRVINGADAVRVLRHVVALLESPFHLLLES